MAFVFLQSLFVLKFNESSKLYEFSNFPLNEYLTDSDFDIEGVHVNEEGDVVTIVSESKKIFVFEKLSNEPKPNWNSLIFSGNMDAAPDIALFFLNTILFGDIGFLISQVSNIAEIGEMGIDIERGNWKLLGSWQAKSKNVCKQS